MFRDEFVGVSRQAQMVWQPAPTILLRVDPLDGRVVHILLESRLFKLLLADWHELAQRRLGRVECPSLRCFEARLGRVVTQADFKTEALHARIRSSLRQVCNLFPNTSSIGEQDCCLVDYLHLGRSHTSRSLELSAHVCCLGLKVYLCFISKSGSIA